MTREELLNLQVGDYIKQNDFDASEERGYFRYFKIKDIHKGNTQVEIYGNELWVDKKDFGFMENGSLYIFYTEEWEDLSDYTIITENEYVNILVTLYLNIESELR